MTLGKKLEERAQAIASAGTTKEGDPVSLLEGEIVLCLEQLEQRRVLHRDLLLHLLKAETYVDTDLAKLESYSPNSVHYRFLAKDSLKTKLFQIDSERRQLLIAFRRDVSNLEERLLHLLGQHAMIQHSSA